MWSFVFLYVMRCADFSVFVCSSLALISARATINSLEVLSLLTSSYLYILCQALDLRALQSEFGSGLDALVREEFEEHFGWYLSGDKFSSALSQVMKAMHETLESTSTMDAVPRMQKVAASSSTIIVDLFTTTASVDALTALPRFRNRVASRASKLLEELQGDYLEGRRGQAPASKVLNRTRAVYEFVRVTLGIRMHGLENRSRFENGLGVEEQTIGQNVSLIHEVRFFSISFCVVADC
jgi:phenylalanine ammonia-lyase